MCTRRWLSIGVLTLVLGGCAARAADPAQRSGTYGTVPGQPPSDVSPARTVLNVVGTPFFLVFKAAVCAITVVIAAPGAAIVGLTDDPSGKRDELAEGFAQNCGPPYILQ